MTERYEDIANDVWLEHRNARARLDAATEARASSRGVGRIISWVEHNAAKRAVEDTGEHLDMIEEIARHVAEPTPHDDIPPTVA